MAPGFKAPSNLHESLVELARYFVGVVEISPNKGPLIELFQRAVDGKASGEPWCAAFIQFLLQQIDDEIRDNYPSWPGHKIPRTESTIEMWERSTNAVRFQAPNIGMIMVWQHFKEFQKDGRSVWVPTRQGHCGLVMSDLALDGTIMCCEGNTNEPSDKVVREGDGVWIKKRRAKVIDGPMRVLGFLDPYP